MTSFYNDKKPSICFGGFTLIELLVVVLIIGILAAVALPQYTKAVNKSRAAQALPVVKSLVQATELYYMTNGSMPQSVEELDIGLPADRIFTTSPDSTQPLKYMFRITAVGSVQAKAASPDLPHYEAHPVEIVPKKGIAVNSGKFWCWVSADKSAQAEEICKSMGTFDSDSSAVNGGGRYYILK